jgi:hypothetical protein
VGTIKDIRKESKKEEVKEVFFTNQKRKVLRNLKEV